MQWLILIGIGIIWFISWVISEISDGISRSADRRKIMRALGEERNKKYGNRVINRTKNLFERNFDIISDFEKKVTAHSQTSSDYPTYHRYSSRHFSPDLYYIDNLTRDCINEIALAENEMSVSPNAEYLSRWKPKAPKDWQYLAIQVEATLRNKQQRLIQEEKDAQRQKQVEDTERAENERKLRQEQLEKEEAIKKTRRKVERYRWEFDRIKADRKDYFLLKKIYKRKEQGDLCLEDIPSILKVDLRPWYEIEDEIISKSYKAIPFSLLTLDEGDVDDSFVHALNYEISEFNKAVDANAQQGNEVRDFFKNNRKGYGDAHKNAVIERTDFVINSITLPPSIPKIWDVDFEPTEGILIIEIKLPDVVHNQVFREVSLRSGKVKKPITQKEQREIVPSFHPAVMLRIAYEIFRNDNENTVKLLVLNGWVEFDDPTTGNATRTYTASLAVQKEQIANLKLSKLEPVSAFAGLKGKSAGRIVDIIPIEPTLTLNRKDARFVDAKEVIDKLGTETNLASMDWQDFEHLIREMFEKEFSGRGAEVKITQASRDKGVDAVVFDPDPIHGGKYVIQAKRYTNTVDVSAVRDLCAVVRKEGASRGILVTTSTYGADAYAFAQNEPVTLLNGAELLGLLKKHGYTFRINLTEARKINNANTIKELENAK